jgi:hypothetical protein
VKLAGSLLFLLATVTGALAQGGHGDLARPFDQRMMQLPPTEADFDRASHPTQHLHNFVTDVVENLHIRDGKAELFDAHDLAPANGELSASVGARGATLRLRW